MSFFSLFGGVLIFTVFFLVIEARGGTWFRTPCPIVVRSRSSCSSMPHLLAVPSCLHVAFIYLRVFPTVVLLTTLPLRTPCAPTNSPRRSPTPSPTPLIPTFCSSLPCPPCLFVLLTEIRGLNYIAVERQGGPPFQLFSMCPSCPELAFLQEPKYTLHPSKTPYSYVWRVKSCSPT